MKAPTGELVALTQRVWGSFLGRCVQRFVGMAGIDRCIVLSSQAFTALIPLLLLVSALAPSDEPDVVSASLIRKFGLTGKSANAVEQLFQIPDDAVNSSLSIFSAVLLVFSGVSFSRRLQVMYRAAWRQEKAGVRSQLFAALGLFALLAEVLLLYGIHSLARHLSAGWLVTLPLSAATGLVLWTSIPYLLLDRQVHWRRLLVAGGVSATGTAIYGVATAIYMPPLIERYTNEFGLFGISIALIGWLLAVSGVVVASAAIGAEFDASLSPWAVRLKVRYHLVDPDLEPPEVSEAARESGLDAGDLLLLFRVLASWLVIAAAVWAATAVVPGIDVPGGLLTYLGVSFVLGLVNAVLGPLVRLVALPWSLVTLGLLALVVNGLLLAVSAALSENLDISGFGTAVLGALVISMVTTLLDFVLPPMRPRDHDGVLTRSG
jgi:uncharacterized membrane protein YvlD (DUF360 family)